jgi:hypothetical protein
MDLLLAIVAMVQDRAAEEIFDKIEKAATVRVKCAGEPSIVVLLKDDKVCVRIAGGGFIVSDGKRVAFKRKAQAPILERDAPAGLEDFCAAGIARVGVALSLPEVFSILSDRLEAPSSKDEIRDVKREGGVLTYSFVAPDGKASQAKLWYDPKTFAPVKRVTVAGEVTLTESYDVFEIDREIADSEFAPEAKARKLAADSAGWHVGVEMEEGKVTFVLLAASGDVTETEDGFSVASNGLTVKIGKIRGLHVIDRNGRGQLVAMPEGWGRDVVGDYREYAKHNSGPTIRGWLAEALKQRPCDVLGELLRKR